MKKIFFLLVLFITACARYETKPEYSASKSEIKNVKGEEIYQQNCIACHGSDGTGALSGVPDLTNVVGFSGNPTVHTKLFQHIEHVKNGLKRPGSPMAMPAKGGNPNLTDQDIKEVLKYMHEKFTNE